MFQLTAFFFLKIMVSLFIGVLFTQSGLDKAFDFKGNKAYIQSVFEKTFLKNVSTLLLITITLLEISSGIACLAGVWVLFSTSQSTIATLGLELGAIALVCLFTGQRIAKDYAGAVSLANYFILVALGLIILNVSIEF